MTKTQEDLLKEIYDNTREIATLRSCMSVLDWDERTYMPRNGSENRANQVSLLAGMAHEKFVSPRIGEIINELVQNGLRPDQDTVDSANIRELKRIYEKEIKIPKSLVEELSRTITMSQGVWQEARQNSDFASFKPWMEKVVKLKQQQAEAVGYAKAAYDAMLDDFEPGASTEKIAQVFAS